MLELPLIVNPKTVDPTDASSTSVIQMESAMGAAIEVFEGSTVIEVDRSRFLPVKATSDLLLLRSDVYELADDFTLVAQGRAPLIDLDASHYKLVGDFDARFAQGAPSLRGATGLTVRGDWTFGRAVVAEGDAALEDPGVPSTVPDGARVGPQGVVGGV